MLSDCCGIDEYSLISIFLHVNVIFFLLLLLHLSGKDYSTV